MVGLFGIGSKASSPSRPRGSPSPTPPPPYRENTHDQPVFATETTTTTTHVVTTTMHTTTHFFSLPLWRRRGASSVVPPAAPQAFDGLESDEFGTMGPRVDVTPMMTNKDLPPTPPLASSMDQSTPQDVPSSFRQQRPGQFQDTVRPSMESGFGLPMHSISVLSSELGGGSESSHSTSMLAQAALGIGLTHTMPVTVSSSSSSDLNTTNTALAPNSPTFVTLPVSESRMRRAKSFHKDGGNGSEPSPSMSSVLERRRARGLSLGPFHFSSDSKGKQREEVDEVPSPPKLISRKSSFWSRKRVDSHLSPSPALLQTYDNLPRPSLPLLQPVSPLYIDTQTASSPKSAVLSSQPPIEFQRRHSERFRSRLDRPAPQSADEAPTQSSSKQHTRRRRPTRPQTADSPSSPRFSSFFPDAPPIIPSPPQLPSPLPPMNVNFELLPSLAVPSATPILRSRSGTNPPLLHRLSVNLFGSSSVSSPPVSQGNNLDLSSISPSSSFSSSRPSLSKAGPEPSKTEIPRPLSDIESPEVYLQRLTEAVSKSEIATVLASNAESFHARTLRAYIDQFDFIGNPLDVALRKLLMDVGLPRETQQIDRVMEAFAARYTQCNPSLFVSDDHPYILAFSLIMLHTDAFNKSNKRKMTKPDYVKNTRLPGVASEVLDCFYDNIVFAPFIFIEDPVDVNGQRGLVPDAIPRRMSTVNGPSPNASGSTLLGKSSKIDPYYLITHNLLQDLRVDVISLVPPENPYVYQGTGGSWDEEELLRAFAMASVVEVNTVEHKYHASPWFSLNVGGAPAPIFQSSITTNSTVQPSGQVFSIKVTKVGLIQRKEEQLERGKRSSNRKWREWSLLLTGSQLLFFRDSAWATSLISQADQVLPRSSMPTPDELLSVKDTVAVFDRTYAKYPNTFRLVIPDGRHYLMQAQDEMEMNQWISRINYASAFKSAGVRMRSLGMSGKDIELTGIAAAASHLRDMERAEDLNPSSQIKTWNGRRSDDLNISSRTHIFGVGPGTTNFSDSSTGDLPVTPPSDKSSSSLKATFDQVKMELASGREHISDEPVQRGPGRQRAYSFDSIMFSPPPTASRSDDVEPSRMSSRAQIIRSKVRDLEAKINLARTHLDSDLRLVRNLGVLTPFQRATRDKVFVAVQNAAKRIMQVRLDLERLVCHRDVLSDDLVAEERRWQRTKKIALRAATATLQNQREHTLPRMTFSYSMDESELPVSLMSVGTVDMSPDDHAPLRVSDPDSSAAEFTQSPIEVDAPNWDGYLSPTSPSHHLLDSPMTTASTWEGSTSAASTGSLTDGTERSGADALTPQNPLDSAPQVRVSREHEDDGHDHFYTAGEMPVEQAEEWNKTRAAKRVSLVKLPSDLRISALFGKQGRSVSQGGSDGTVTSTSSPNGHSLFHRGEATANTVTMLDL